MKKTILLAVVTLVGLSLTSCLDRKYLSMGLNDPEHRARPVSLSEYYPLAKGQVSEFRTSDGHSFRISVGKRESYLGREAFKVTLHTIGGSKTETYQTLDQEAVYLAIPSLETGWIKAYEGPPVDGMRWSYKILQNLFEYQWERVTCPQVTGGIFNDCFKAVHTNAPDSDYTIFARGAGTIYSVSGTQTMELVSRKNDSKGD